MTCATPRSFTEQRKTTTLVRTAKELSRRSDEVLRDVAFVLALTRRVKTDILAEDERAAER